MEENVRNIITLVEVPPFKYNGGKVSISPNEC